jgi:hypothetical protein
MPASWVTGRPSKDVPFGDIGYDLTEALSEHLHHVTGEEA